TPESTRVEVREGKVHVSRLSDGAACDVVADQFVSVAANGPVEAKLFPIDEILLTPAKGTLVGTDWRVQRDVETGSGVALEALKAQKGPLQDAPCVVFPITVEAGKT